VLLRGFFGGYFLCLIALLPLVNGHLEAESLVENAETLKYRRGVNAYGFQPRHKVVRVDQLLCAFKALDILLPDLRLDLRRLRSESVDLVKQLCEVIDSFLLLRGEPFVLIAVLIDVILCEFGGFGKRRPDTEQRLALYFGDKVFLIILLILFKCDRN